MIPHESNNAMQRSTLVEPGQLGAMYFVPTVIVPLLLITHGLTCRLLLTRPQRK